MLIAAKITIIVSLFILQTAEGLEDKKCPKISIIIQGKEVDNEGN